MLDRKQILKQAYHDCMKEMYAKAQPPADYDQLLKLAEAGENAEIYKRHFLSVEEFRYILNKYIKAYKIKESWIPNMELLEEYLREGGHKDKWIESHTDENGNYHTGYRGYEDVLPLNKQILDIISKYGLGEGEMYKEICDTVFNTIKDCKNFYKFDRENSDFSCSIALGASPISDPTTVKEYWKSQGIDLDIEIRNPLLFWEFDYYEDTLDYMMSEEYGEHWREYWDSKWKEYALPNRDGAKLYLYEIEEGKYALNVDTEHSYVLEYVRVSINDDGDYNMYDPAGGPYMYPGYKISEDKVITRIFQEDGLVKFEINGNIS